MLRRVQGLGRAEAQTRLDEIWAFLEGDDLEELELPENRFLEDEQEALEDLLALPSKGKSKSKGKARRKGRPRRS